MPEFFRGEGALILPHIWLAVFGLAILLTDFLFEKRLKWLNAVSALLGLMVSGAALILLYLKLLNDRQEFFSGFNGSIRIDSFFIFFGLLFLAATALVVLLSVRYLEIEEEHHGEYYALILFATVGMLFMASGMDLVVLFLGLETMAISFYILTGFLRRDRRSNEGALKYLLLGAFSSGLLAYGFSLLYGLSGSTNLLGVLKAMRAADPSNILVLVALITVSAGLFFKVAAVPFHQWAPDVYEGAPTSITAYVSVASKAASFAMLVRIFVTAFEPLREGWQILFAAVAVVTMTVGNFAAITQNNVKRLLAYSSIAHVGYILLGLVAGNLTGLKGIQFYLFAYAFMNTGAFAIVILLRRKGLIGDELEDMDGLYQRSPTAAVLLLIFMLSLAGIPPTAGFMGKYFIFLGLIESGHIWLAVFAVLYIVPALYYYFRIVQHAWMREPGDAPATTVSLGQAVALAVTAVVTLGAGIFPEAFVEMARASVFHLGR
jgi:NADH-quinone oxidoreductase subunit N